MIDDNTLLLKYKTVSPFFSNWLWVKVFREAYIFKHNHVFIGFFELITLYFQNK